ncbi:MAG TPA: hypothetical protein VK034_31170 [Enhygromyxa sp.]|nr:hypothetical protein [Enhygromyxa sp.]
MTRLRIVEGCSSVVLLLALAGLSGCDKLPGFGGEQPADGEPQASADEQPEQPSAEPTAKADETSPAPADAVQPGEQPVEQPPTPEPEQPPTPTPSEFDGLLVRVSGLADPKAATEPTVEQDNKTAWTHYKAKQWPEAAQFFARVAARDPAWKHAHNLACASAKAGRPDDARIALAESLKRGGVDATASAKKDSDLATVRELPWFAELLAKPADPEQSPTPSYHADEGDEDDDLEFADNDTPPPNCPPDATHEHYCWHDTLASFKYEELAFDTPVSLSLEVPARPKDKRYKLIRSKIPWKELRAELGIQHTIESVSLTTLAKPNLMEWSSMVWEDEAEIEQDADELTPYFWWPEDNTPILVLPNRQKVGKLRLMGVVLARKTDSGWRAINLTVTKPDQFVGSTNADFESGSVLRFDGLELFTLTQFVYHDGYGKHEIDERSRFFCRIRWEQGKLARACTERWTETGKTFG